MSHEQQQLTVIGWEGRTESRRGVGAVGGVEEDVPTWCPRLPGLGCLKAHMGYAKNWQQTKYGLEVTVCQHPI